MRNVIYCAPFPNVPTTARFAWALAGLKGVRLLGVFQQPPHGDLARCFHDIAVVPNVFDAAALARGVEALRRAHGHPHRIVGILEDLQVQLARVRAHLEVPGPDVTTAERFRDKALMKDTLRAAGIPCARHQVLRSEADAWAFAERVGFPQVLKPPAGAGCKATWRIDHADQLREALATIRPSPTRSTLAEEFLTGQEYSFETVTIAGQPVFHSISRYYPGPLEVVRNDWIQWVTLLPRDISGPEFHEARRVGVAAVKTLGLRSGMTHMEWFRRPDGSVAVGEIAARPPGAQIVTLMGWAHDADLHRAWARAVVDDAFDGPLQRKYAVGCAYLRGSGEGTRVASVAGLAEAQQIMGGLVVEARLPRPGQPRSSSYEGEGFVIVRHPDTERVKRAVLKLIETVRVRYR